MVIDDVDLEVGASFDAGLAVRAVFEEVRESALPGLIVLVFVLCASFASMPVSLRLVVSRTRDREFVREARLEPMPAQSGVPTSTMTKIESRVFMLLSPLYLRQTASAR